MQCVKCCKLFPTAHALLKHQQSNSEAYAEAHRQRLALADNNLSVESVLQQNAQAIAASEGTDALNPIQKVELHALIDMDERIDNVCLDKVKEHVCSINEARRQQLTSTTQAFIQQLLDKHDVDDRTSLDEIATVIQQGFATWDGANTRKQMESRRRQQFPFTQPQTRRFSMKKGDFCVDLPFEQQLQGMWNADPQSYHTMRAYSELVVEKVAAINAAWTADPDADWEVDDYFTAEKGLQHPRLGKRVQHIGTIGYADGVDHIDLNGAFAGKQKVVISLLECMLFPPSERVQYHNIFLVNVCMEKVAKGVGYATLWGGDPDNPSCTSIGGSMRRLYNGLLFDTPFGRETWTGELYTAKADNPQLNNLLSTKESVGPSTKQICKECMLLQVDLRRPDLKKSYMDDTPPIPLRTAAEAARQKSALKAIPVLATRRKQAMMWGWILTDDESQVLPNAFEHFPDNLKDKVYDRQMWEGQHDIWLGPFPELIGKCLFYWTHDKKNPNYFTFAQLQRRYNQYPWEGCKRGDIPPPFRPFAGREKKQGPLIFGPTYQGWPVPQKGTGLKWTAAMAVTFCLHCVAFLLPLIKDKAERKWKLLVLYQRICIWSLQWTTTRSEARRMDVQVRNFAAGYLTDAQLKPFWKLKLHKHLHGPKNSVTVATTRAGWVYREEMFLRRCKRAAKASNNINTPLAIAQRISKKSAWQWTTRKPMATEASGEYATEVAPHTHTMHQQLCSWSGDNNNAPLELSWYNELRYKGRRYCKGVYIMYEAGDGDVSIATVVSPVKIAGLYCLVINVFNKYRDGSSCWCNYNIWNVHQHMMNPSLVLLVLHEGLSV